MATISLGPIAFFMLAFGQAHEPIDAGALTESLLWGFEMAPPNRTSGLPADGQRRLVEYRRRERSCRQTVPRPQDRDRDGPLGSLYFKRVGLERALFSLNNRKDSLALAESFATTVKWLYEWEGFADSPLLEASSADEFLAQHRTSPLAAYLQLFAGHRKLCAASGLDRLDPQSARDGRIAREADAQLSAARDSGDPLIRVVAEYLLERRKCFER